MLTRSSVHPFQRVSTARLVDFFLCPEDRLPLPSPVGRCPQSVPFFLCPHKFLPLLSPGSKCHLLSHFFCVLTSPIVCHLQLVSTPHSVVPFHLLTSPYPPPCSDSECPSLGPFISVSRQVPLSSISRKSVAFTRSVSYRVLTSPSICRAKSVSALCSVPLFLYLDRSLPLLSLGSECPLLGRFLLLF